VLNREINYQERKDEPERSHVVSQEELEVEENRTIMEYLSSYVFGKKYTPRGT
jgi:hypothetical protein